MMIENKLLLLIGLIFLIIIGCTFPGGGKGETSLTSIEVESFRNILTITVRWPRDVMAEEYVLMRARDEIHGAGIFEEIYRGQATNYIDREVLNNIRYIYRVDIVKDGQEVKGEQTEIGVGSSAEIDVNEPNNQREEATALNLFRRGTMYFFRFSDGREMKDVDWYRIRVRGRSVAFVRIVEDGAVEMTTLRMSIDGQECLLVEQGKWYEIKNDTLFEREFFIEITPDKDSYLDACTAGGMIRGYTIIRSDTNEEPWVPGDPGEPGYPGEPEDPVNPGESYIEERRELFVTDTSGYIVFLLNEAKYQGRSYTFWKHLDNDWEATEGMSMDLIKESGNFMGGYGFFFAGGYVQGHGECMLVFLMQTEGRFTIGKVVEGRYEELVPWRSSIYLRKGYGVRNTIAVRFDAAAQETHEYVLTINGMDVLRFVDILEPVCTGTRTGVVAVLTSVEQFPQTPVRVRYR